MRKMQWQIEFSLGEIFSKKCWHHKVKVFIMMRLFCNQKKKKSVGTGCTNLIQLQISCKLSKLNIGFHKIYQLERRLSLFRQFILIAKQSTFLS